MNTNMSLFFGSYQNTSTNVNVVYNDGNEDTYVFNVTQQVYGSSPHMITDYIQKYVIPIICVLGLIGNTIASLVFLQKPLRKRSCSIFLTVRGFSDNGFLFTLLIIWISRTFELRLGEIRNSCQIIIFLTYVCGCISVWLVVFLTAENYIRICRPFIVNRVCTTNVARFAVGILFVVSVCIYSFPFWAMNPDTCIPYAQYYKTVQIFIYADTLLTLVVPLICITLVMTAIVCSLLKSYNRRSRLRAPTAKRVKNPMAKVTKMLFAVTVTFICLNLPSHINRLRIMISSIFAAEEQQGHYSSLEEAIQQITLLVYYISLTTNLIVYYIFGSRFRKVLKDMTFLPSLNCSNEKNVNKDMYKMNRMITKLRKFENKTESVEITAV
ncbi:C-C chemokine receptor type 1-like [Ruditapes philippinarum]|uniref:C-C chemokine receptor type 1-like n=1 Tax=Ruditapes philippinarum TaxID=129788 RepID=UPI00295C2A54|nr:C-C chemokine receptor type 1-like [Ruditapes philippinarum]